MTLEHYQRLGGVGGALARHAESSLTAWAPKDGSAPSGSSRLVQVGRGAPDTRRPRSREEIARGHRGARPAETVLLRLTGMRTGHEPEETQGLRLIMPSGGEQPSQQRMELAHETLLHKVRSLVAWLQQERTRLELQEDLEATARSWGASGGCPAEGLPTDTWLAHYRAVLGSPSLKRGERPRGPLPSSRRTSGAAARLLQRALVAAALLAGLIILVFAARAEQARQAAEQARRAAERAQQLAEQERNAPRRAFGS